MKRSLISNLRLQRLQQIHKKHKLTNESLKFNIKRLTIILFFFLCLFIVLYYRSFDELIHDIGDLNTILEPILFVVLFVIFLIYFIKKK